MGQRKYPPLEPREIIDILIARGFSLRHTKGDHKYYSRAVRGRKHVVQIDEGCPLYEDDLIKLVLKESGMTREQFYCSTKRTAKKINRKPAPDDDLAHWADE